MSWRETYREHLRVDGSIKSSASVEIKATIFIARAKEVHGGLYDYSTANYTRAHDQVTIICPIHGKFSQKAHNHLQGQGCPMCSGNKKKSTRQFIEEATAVHRSTYTYDNVEYINDSTKVKITCRDHGDFEQTPSNHLRGNGCPKCAGKNQNTIYLIEYLAGDTRLGTKVGITNSFDRRFTELKGASPYDVAPIQSWIVDNPRDIESAVLKRFTKAGKLGASFDGSTEILSEPTEEIVQFIEELVYAS